MQEPGDKKLIRNKERVINERKVVGIEDYLDNT